jgi:phosphomannomutase
MPKNTMQEITCFKAYDIRGRLGAELNEDIAYRIGRACGDFLKPRSVVVGGDVRETSAALKLALANGLQAAGVDVLDIGLAGTEEVYFATFHLGVDGGIEVTASHNPIDYNGMKLVREGAKPISGDTGLKDIQRLAQSGEFATPEKRGSYRQVSILEAYVDHLLDYIDPAKFTPLKLVVNIGNGAAGHVIDALAHRFQALNTPLQLITLHPEPDPTFPHGIPNPLLPDNRHDTIAAVQSHRADVGIAFDGDFDRCFFFDENGRFIEGYYVVGLLAEAFLHKNPGAKIIYDPRLTWNTIDVVKQNGGVAIQSKTGHAFIKERMRTENAVYGGEMSAHHYFRDFAYCDSGMIPWLLVLELLSVSGKPLSELVNARMQAYPCSGEINFTVGDVRRVIDKILAHYQNAALAVDKTDGVGLTFPDWRFNLRASNTEPVLRLNVESRANQALMEEKTAELGRLIQDLA